MLENLFLYFRFCRIGDAILGTCYSEKECSTLNKVAVLNVNLKLGRDKGHKHFSSTLQTREVKNKL